MPCGASAGSLSAPGCSVGRSRPAVLGAAAPGPPLSGLAALVLKRRTGWKVPTVAKNAPGPETAYR